jgi:hypothetical protein
MTGFLQTAGRIGSRKKRTLFTGLLSVTKKASPDIKVRFSLLCERRKASA